MPHHHNSELLPRMLKTQLMVDCLHKRIENPKTENINAQDTESGYTAMHHCLYHGKLLNALELLKLQPDLGIRDREGNTCLDVFYATIPKLESDNLPHVSVWTWGSNSNFLLGDSRDNRTLPDQLNLVTDKREPRIEDLKMSKYHACLISDHRLYVWGFGQGGRLGLGHETTITIPTRVKISGQVQFVALGPDNTLVITDHGRLWSFGSNEFQQLGYPLDKDKQLVPNEISIKKVQFKACAISKYHACAITYTGSVYTWGTNHGQLGYQQPVQVSPRKVTSFPQQDLLSISCTNTATCVLTQTHEVHVFSNDCLKRIQFPKFSTKTLGQKELPIKIVSGNHQFGCLMSTGDVYMWSPPEKQYQDTWQQQYFPQSKPRRVWSVKKKYLAAVDVAIGIDSCLMIATSCGLVYLGERKQNLPKNVYRKEQEPIFKFTKQHQLHHIISVCASSSGAFGSIRSDQRPKLCPVEDSCLSQDMLNMKHIPHDILVKSREKVFSCHKAILCARSIVLNNILSGKDTKDWVQFDQDLVFDVQPLALERILDYIYTGTCTRPEGSVMHQYKKAETQEQQVFNDFYKLLKLLRLDETQYLLASDPNPSLVQSFTMLQDLDKNLILETKDKEVWCHSMVACRIPALFPLLKKDSPWNVEKRDGIPVVDFKHVDSTCMERILQFCYTDDHLLFEEEEDLLFVLDCFYLATELLIERLVSLLVCQLLKSLTIRNVFEIMDTAMTFHSQKLLNGCMDFCIDNLTTFIYNQRLQQPIEILQALEDRIQQLQREKMPLMRGVGGYYEQIKLLAQSIDEPIELFDSEETLYEVDQIFSNRSSLRTLLSNSSMETIKLGSPALLANPTIEEEMFELELEETKKKRFNTSPQNSPSWTPINHKVSLRDVMSEQSKQHLQKPPPNARKSPSLGPTSVSNSPMSTPLLKSSPQALGCSPLSLTESMMPLSKKMSQRERKKRPQSMPAPPTGWNTASVTKPSLKQIQEEQMFQKTTVQGTQQKSLLKYSR